MQIHDLSHRKWDWRESRPMGSKYQTLTPPALSKGHCPLILYYKYISFPHPVCAITGLDVSAHGVIFWPLNGLRKKWLFQHQTAKLRMWWRICTFLSTQGTSGGLDCLVCWRWRWLAAAFLYPATFSDLPYTVSAALMKSVHSVSWSMKLLPIPSTLTFFIPLFIS